MRLIYLEGLCCLMQSKSMSLSVQYCIITHASHLRKRAVDDVPMS